MRTRRLLAFLVIYLTVSSAKGDEAVTRKVRAELPEALTRLHKTYSRVSGRAVVADSTDYDLVAQALKTQMLTQAKSGAVMPRGVVVFDRSRIEFALDGAYRKVVIESELRPMLRGPNNSPPRKTPARVVYCVGPLGSFHAEWAEAKSAPELKSFDLEGDRVKTRFGMEVDVYLESIYKLPFGFLPDLVADPKFKIKNASETNLDGSRCILIEFEYEKLDGRATKPGQTPIMVQMFGHVVLDPARSWAIRKYEYHDPKNLSRTQEARVDYAEGVGDRPTPRSITLTGGKVRVHACKIVQFDFNPIPAEQFLPSAFGLPSFEVIP